MACYGARVRVAVGSHTCTGVPFLAPIPSWVDLPLLPVLPLPSADKPRGCFLSAVPLPPSCARTVPYRYDVGGRPTYQLACYPGGGARYVRHADASVSCPSRTVTAIVYLTAEWDVQVGFGAGRVDGAGSVLQTTGRRSSKGPYPACCEGNCVRALCAG